MLHACSGTLSMPLTRTQRAAMDILIQYNTDTVEDVSNTITTFRTYTIDSIERIMDSDASRIRGLALPNSWIVNPDKASFWHTMAIIATGDEAVEWHAMEYGEPVNETDRKSRYVYTWRFNNAPLQFYTKIIHKDTVRKSLEWFVCKQIPNETHSGDDTDSGEIW